jgi:pimeloyl-ACP methyl ester carboxylesterase
MAGMGAENVAEFGATMAGPQDLQEFLEHEGSWVGTVTADDITASFGDLISDVDKAALTGEYAEWLAKGFRASVSSGIWGWFDDDLAFAKPWGFELDAISRPVAIWQGAQDRMVPFAHGQWLAAHVPGARPHLYAEHGHLSLAVASFGTILDDLIELST